MYAIRSYYVTIFVELRYIPSWMLILILGREFLVTGIRSIAASNGEVIPVITSYSIHYTKLYEKEEEPEQEDFSIEK